jgi:hypothetical protein
MPRKPARPCRFIGCLGTTTAKTGYCDRHAHLWRPYERFRRSEPCPGEAKRGSDGRPSSARRGYDGEWRRLRAETLAAAGIPREDWPLYDVHHEPPYNPDVEPDHRKYRLTPLLHGEHSGETGRQKRLGGRKKNVGPL